MRKDELKQLYESIMHDVAKVVKRRILEYGDFTSSSDEDNFDIRDYMPGYKMIVDWIEQINDELDNNSSTLDEALEPLFRYHLDKYIKNKLKDYAQNIYVYVRDTSKVKYVDVMMSEGPVRFIDIVLDEPNKNDFVPVISQFMEQRNYSLLFFTIRKERVHIIYGDNEGVKVDFEELDDKPYFDGRIYHLTTKENAIEIMRNGFELRSRNNDYGISYSPRTYFFTSKESALKYTDTIAIEHQNENLTLVSIPIDDVLDIDFFYDPLTEEYEGIYTETKINVTEHMSSEDVTL